MTVTTTHPTRMHATKRGFPRVGASGSGAYGGIGRGLEGSGPVSGRFVPSNVVGASNGLDATNAVDGYTVRAA